MMGNRIVSRSFVQMLAANVNNEKLSDEAFREIVRNTITHVEGGATLNNMMNPIPDGKVRTWKLAEETDLAASAQSKD